MKRPTTTENPDESPWGDPHRFPHLRKIMRAAVESEVEGTMPDQETTPEQEEDEERQDTLSFLLGQSAGVAAFASRLRKEAGEAFGNERDDIAHTLRSTAIKADVYSRGLRRDWVNAHRCQADRDGDCEWHECPQNRDNEPHKSGRPCPLIVNDPEE